MSTIDPNDLPVLSSLIKEKALQLGFSACGICKAEHTGQQTVYFSDWIKKKYHGKMSYLEKYTDMRSDPRLLLDNAQTILVTALNYFPKQKQKKKAPQFAYYAYGTDYHVVVKEKLLLLYQFIQQQISDVQGIICCDTAPLLEKYHAQKAGLGWIGKNTQLIMPNQGSYFFLGEIIIDKPLVCDSPVEDRCGTCDKCIMACPTHALWPSRQLDATRCLSYLTIECKYPCSEKWKVSSDYVYGCDECSKICPHNQQAIPTSVESFTPSPEFLQLTTEEILRMDEATFKQLFDKSAVMRIGLERLKQNVL